jgi:alkaline phosphatase D
MTKLSFKIILIFTVLASCNPPIQDIFLGQGIMSGEATSSSIILQSRLTIADTLINDDLPGQAGSGIFQVALNSNFDNPISSALIKAIPKNDI